MGMSSGYFKGNDPIPDKNWWGSLHVLQHLFIVSGDGGVFLVLILCIRFFIVRAIAAFGHVKDELTGRHSCIHADGTAVRVAHLKGDGSGESGIDPAAGLMEGDAEACHAAFTFDGGDDVIGQRDCFQGFGKDELSGLDVKIGSFSFLCMCV